MTVRTSRALICCSNVAARRDVDERTSSRELEEIIGMRMVVHDVRQQITWNWLWWRVIRYWGERREEWERT